MRYTTSDVSKLLRLSPRHIRSFVHAGFIKPERGARGEFFFTFRDLILLRTAAALRAADISHSSILKSMRMLRRQLPASSTLTEVRIVADGRRVVVDDGSSAWNPDSGQLLLDFDVAELAAKAEPIAKKRFQLEADYNAGEWFDIAVELEAVAPIEARQAYARALALEPRHVAAHINLGRLLHEDGLATEAATHYLQALRYQPENATAAFNLGVALEDVGRLSEAMKAYQQAIDADPSFADPHYNLAAIMEKIGDKRGAIRHLTKYRKLSATPS